MKEWRLEKDVFEDGKVEYSLYDNKLGFAVQYSLNEWMLPDIYNTCGGKENIEFMFTE